MRIDLLRHGACDDDVWLRGVTDSELSDNGWQQMHQQCKRLHDYDLIISSDLKRCLNFCQSFQIDEDGFSIQTAWQERNFGLFDGLSYGQVEKQYPSELASYLQDPFMHSIPEAEGFSDFKLRICQAWSAILQQGADNVLLVTHGGPVRMVLQEVLDLSNHSLFQLEIGYGARVSIEVINSGNQPFCKLLEIVQSPELT